MTLWEQAVRYKWKTKSAKPIAKHDMAHRSGYPLLLSKGSPTSPLSRCSSQNPQPSQDERFGPLQVGLKLIPGGTVSSRAASLVARYL